MTKQLALGSILGAITHRLEITSLKDIDDEVKRWLKVAYDRDA